MNILVVGSGAREHALSWKLAQSTRVHRIFCLPGNAGTAGFATNLAGRSDDIPGIVQTARDHKIDFVVVGPEEPLVRGLVDALAEAGVLAFGPTRAAAQLEGSKAFAKALMREAQVPTAEFAVFTDANAAEQFVREAGRAWVVKADGLAAGKGVIVADDLEQTLTAIRTLMREQTFGAAGATVVLEERLFGQEVSYHVICDGERYVALAAAQDHKRVHAGDQGPNTGGMGAYSPPPVVTPEVEHKILTRIVEPTLRALKNRGTPFRGVLFVGLMIDQGEPRVLEYNVRFGDPETQVLIARHSGDFLPLLLGAARGDLSGVAVQWSAPCALSVVMAARGYPGAYEKGHPILGLGRTGQEAMVFHAGTALHEGKVVTAGGRVLAVTATGQSLDEAAARAYTVVNQIHFEGAQFRADIGHHARSK